MSTIIAIAGVVGQPITTEKKSAAGSAIQAGHIVEELSTGEVREQSTAANAQAQRLIALENQANGGTVDDVYLAGESVRFGAFSQGQEAFVRVAAGAAAIAIGGGLDTATDGTLKAAAGAASIAYALEAVDNSGGASSVLIKARVA